MYVVRQWRKSSRIQELSSEAMDRMRSLQRPHNSMASQPNAPMIVLVTQALFSTSLQAFWGRYQRMVLPLHTKWNTNIPSSRTWNNTPKCDTRSTSLLKKHRPYGLKLSELHGIIPERRRYGAHSANVDVQMTGTLPVLQTTSYEKWKKTAFPMRFHFFWEALFVLVK